MRSFYLVKRVRLQLTSRALRKEAKTRAQREGPAIFPAEVLRVLSELWDAKLGDGVHLHEVRVQP